MYNAEDIKQMVRVVEDFPAQGISYKDITTVIGNAEVFSRAVDLLADFVADKEFDYFVAPEARGFIFASALAVKMEKGFIPVRKKGKLPYKTVSYKYDLEYGSDEIFIHVDAFKQGAKVVVVDDLLATGGTAKTVRELVKKLGGEVVSFLYLIELDELKGRDKLGDIPVNSLIHYEH